MVSRRKDLQIVWFLLFLSLFVLSSGSQWLSSKIRFLKLYFFWINTFLKKVILFVCYFTFLCFLIVFLVSIQDRKLFFDSFAIANEFDPLIPDNWYNVTYHSLVQNSVFWFPLPLPLLIDASINDNLLQECKAILQYYSSLDDCLMHLYPNIGLQSSRFSKRTYLFFSYIYLLNFFRTLPPFSPSLFLDRLSPRKASNAVGQICSLPQFWSPSSWKLVQCTVN